MIETEREIVKPEMNMSYIWLKTTDGSIQQVEQEVAMFSPLICNEIQSGMGSSKNYPISLPPRVNPAMLSLILDYCRFHQVPGCSNKERKTFDEKFIRLDTKRLCELTSAADSLQLKPLVDLTSRALARMIEGKTAEEIREIFHLPDDLTEEEKLEPLKNTMDDPRIRLLNRLYARKRKELRERQKSKNIGAGGEHVDDRSLDDLLSFINGESEGISSASSHSLDSKGVRTSKNKKKNRRKKEMEKNAHVNCSSSSHGTDNNKKEADGCHSTCQNNTVHHNSLPLLDQSLRLQDTEDDNFGPENEFDDGDDEIDAARKEEIDREVEDFARRLNSDWPQRLQEILSQGQERRSIPMAMNGNGSLRRYTRLHQDQE